jgi:subtilisin family serine protease
MIKLRLRIVYALTLILMLLSTNILMAYSSDTGSKMVNLTYDESILIDERINEDTLSTITLRDSYMLSIDASRDRDLYRVMIVGDGEGIEYLREVGVEPFSYIDTNKGFIAYAALDDHKINVLSSNGLKIIKDFMLTFDNYSASDQFIRIPSSRDANRFDLIYGLDGVHARGITGKGIKVAVVDSGVDFSSIDMADTVAVDSNGKPIMLDADAQGIVLTKTRFKAKIVNNVIYPVELSEEEKKDPYTSSIYINDDGVFLNIKGKKDLRFDVYNPIYPYLGKPVLTAKANVDWKIGKSNLEFIQSKSGIYRMGFFVQLNFQLGNAALIIVPVLVVDSKEPNVYDTIIPDMSTSWADFALFELRKKPDEVVFDLDFTDERTIHYPTASVNDLMLVYDADGDGVSDISAGMLGAYVLDVWNVIKDDDNNNKNENENDNKNDENNKSDVYIDERLGALSGRLLQPVDPKGRYFTVMFDFFGHGTQSSATIVSKGIADYEIYKEKGEGSDSKDKEGARVTHKIIGIAPDAKIIPIKALWFGDIAYAWLWAAGFDLIAESSNSKDDTALTYDHSDTSENADGASKVKIWRWVYTEHRADIINNSWGIPSVPLLEYAPGYDILSILASVLSIPGSLHKDYRGVIVVNSNGNSGHAYGTVTSPASAPLALSVGATTNNVIFTLEQLSKQPRFGNAIDYYDDIADFSSKGPTALGDIKPDVLATGAYGYTPLPVNAKHTLNTKHAWGVFGGTSMASPLTAGALALIVQAMKERSNDDTYDPILTRLILTNTAKDTMLDPLSQGSGRVDILRALDYIEGREGTFIAYTYDTYRNYIKSLEGALDEYASIISHEDYRDYGYPSLKLVDRDIALGKWFAGYIGSKSKEARLIVENNSDSRLDIKVEPTTLVLVGRDEFKDKTEPRVRDEKYSTDDYGYRPKYVRIDMEKIKDADLLVAKLHYPFETFMNTSKDALYANELRIASLYAYDWIDKDNDGKVSYDETAMINRGGAWGTTQHLVLTKPADRIKGDMLIGIYQVPKVFSFWYGMRDKDSSDFEYTLTLEYYKKGRWDALMINGSDTLLLSIEPHGKATLRASIDESKAKTGINYGYITISSSRQVTNIPVSFIVPLTIKDKDIPYVITGDGERSALYTNAMIQGSFDMFSRYNAGEWKYYHMNIDDPTVNTLSIKMRWRDEFTSLSVFILDPRGRIIASNVDAGVFKAFINWPSNDWLGRSVVSDGGGFYPAQNNGSNSAVIYAPVHSPGVYTIMVHNTLFHAKESYVEPLTIELKPAVILPDVKPPRIDVKLVDYTKGIVEFNVDVIDENIEYVVYSIDDSIPSEAHGRITLDTTMLQDGMHVLSIISRDTVGHMTIERYRFYVDNTPPSIDVKVSSIDYDYDDGKVIYKDDKILAKGKLGINVDIRDDTLEGFSITLPDGNVTSISSIELDTKGLSDGIHELRVHAYDKAGNTSEHTLTLMVDNTAPHVTIISPVNESTVSGMLEVRYEIDEANTDRITISVDGNARVVDANTYIIDTRGLIDGKHTIEVIVEDTLGNKGSASVNIIALNYTPVIEAEKESIRVSAKEQGIQQGTLIGIAVGAAVGVGAMIGIYAIRNRVNR